MNTLLTPQTSAFPQTFLETNAALDCVIAASELTPISDILQGLFTSACCDFCPLEAPTYRDPETSFRYCLDCLADAVEAEEQRLKTLAHSAPGVE